MSDDEMSSDSPTKVGETPAIDDEIDEFAESAFDALSRTTRFPCS